MSQKKESLGTRQRRFSIEIARLIVWAYDELGVQLTIGDAFRDPRMYGEFGQEKGYSSKYSCHKLKLAMDLNLFTNNGRTWTYRIGTKAHQKIGEKWESMGEDHRWGGRFDDGNHYSFEYQGKQ